MFSGRIQILLYFLTAIRQDCCQFTHLPNSLPGSPRRPSSPQGSQHFPAPAADERGLQGTAKHPVVWQRALEETLGLWAAWNASSSSKILQSELSFTWASFISLEGGEEGKRFFPHLIFPENISQLLSRNFCSSTLLISCRATDPDCDLPPFPCWYLVSAWEQPASYHTKKWQHLSTMI